jgi:hypothetical protein
LMGLPIDNVQDTRQGAMVAGDSVAWVQVKREEHHTR